MRTFHVTPLCMSVSRDRKKTALSRCQLPGSVGSTRKHHHIWASNVQHGPKALGKYIYKYNDQSLYSIFKYNIINLHIFVREY